MNWEKLFIIGSERGACTYETLREFDRLPYKNKVVFTHIEYPEIQSAYCLRGFEDREELGDTTAFKKQLRRHLDDFDVVSFLNGEGFQ
ncbi:MAG: DUF1919 domain-containing protein [Provencibacterium sp.]|nr:DUF1919 domain-containing protein [Provencibacterium sp.]